MPRCLERKATRSGQSCASAQRSVGAVVRSLVLEPPAWRLTREKLEQAITANTKVVVINSPLNPVGRVFDAEELALLKSQHNKDTLKQLGKDAGLSDAEIKELVEDGKKLERDS